MVPWHCGTTWLYSTDAQATCEVTTRPGPFVHSSLPELGGSWSTGDKPFGVGAVAGDGISETFYGQGGRLVAIQRLAVSRASRLTPVTLVIFDLIRRRLAGCGGDGGTGSDAGDPQPAVAHRRLTVDGMERGYRPYTPPDAGAAGPVPLVLALHGTPTHPTAIQPVEARPHRSGPPPLPTRGPRRPPQT